MKQIIFFLLLALGTFAASGQSYRIDANGNYFTEKKVSNGPATFASLTKNAIDTGKTLRDAKEQLYKVYKSKQGKLFYVRQSKNGNYYSVYLK